MRLSVFIRTYKGDFEWLPYCLAGIKKNVTYDELVICTPDVNELQPLIKGIDCVVVKSVDKCEGYMAQQADKLNAWQWCTGDVIMYVDSDTVYYEKVAVNDFVSDGKINLLRTRYSQIDAPWQNITAKAIGFLSEWEYMRRFPLVYWRTTLESIHYNYPSIGAYICRQRNRAFSEFNFIGQFIEKFEHHKYNLLDTNDGLPKELCKQFWSWGGITDEHKNEIQELLK